MSLDQADKTMIEVSKPNPTGDMQVRLTLCLQSFQVGIVNSTKLELDHHIAYLCHVELARLLAKLGPDHSVEAKHHLDMVLENKIPFGATKGKGKVSMQNAFIIKANGIREFLLVGWGFEFITALRLSTMLKSYILLYTVEQLNTRTND